MLFVLVLCDTFPPVFLYASIPALIYPPNVRRKMYIYSFSIDTKIRTHHLHTFSPERYRKHTYLTSTSTHIIAIVLGVILVGWEMGNKRISTIDSHINSTSKVISSFRITNIHRGAFIHKVQVESFLLSVSREMSLVYSLDTSDLVTLSSSIGDTNRRENPFKHRCQLTLFSEK